MATNEYKIINVVLIGTLILFLFGIVAYAQTRDYYTELAPLPGTISTTYTGTGEPVTDLSTYLPGIFNLSIGIGAVMAFVMITFGGITYMTTDAIGGKTKGRDYVTNALWGLLLVIGAWVILYTINPKILEFNLVLEKPNIATATSTVEVVMIPDCPTCTDLVVTNISITSSGKEATPALKAKLINLDNSLRSVQIAWHISEAWPPSYRHNDACHYDGTCVDANISSATATNINQFLQIARNNNFNATYEVLTQSAMDSLVAQGVSASSMMVNVGASAPHFHIK